MNDRLKAAPQERPAHVADPAPAAAPARSPDSSDSSPGHPATHPATHSATRATGGDLPPVVLIDAACGLGGPPAAEDDLAAGPAALAHLGVAGAVRRAGGRVGAVERIAPVAEDAPADAGRLARLGGYLRRLAAAVGQAAGGGGRLVILGGDHSVAAGTWRGVGQALGEAPGLVWIDAHLDAHVAESSPTGNPHGMPLAALLGLGSPELAWVDGPVLDPQRITVIGARSFEAAELRHLVRLGVKVVPPDDLARLGFARVFADAVARAGRHGTAPFGVTIDLDAFDPEDAPATTVPAPLGLAAGEVLPALRGVLRRPGAVALEIVEYRPGLDRDLRTGRLAVDLVETALAPDAATLADWEMAHGAHNYEPLPLVVSHGEGPWLVDTEGRRYIDMMAAYSAVSFGHSHPRLVATLAAQARRLAVTSRAFSNDRLPVLLKRLTEITGFDLALPANTGLEAVETALKVARKWAHVVKGVPDGDAEIIACAGNFHGRSIAIVGLSTEPQYRAGFGPFPGGLLTIPYGDAAALEAAITPNTAAFLVEPIQGEGGIVVPPPGYLAACAEICRRRNVLLIADEVQTGLGRTGRLLACEHEGVRPDGLCLGKALGGGLLPVSAFLARREVLGVLKPGDHGSTFGGNPLAATVALEALELLLDEDLPARSARLGAWLLARLQGIASPLIKEVRGRGLFVGVEVQGVSARAVVDGLLAAGVVTKDTHGTVIRLAPPLTIDEATLAQAADALERVLAGLEMEARP
ncbi:ornithine--oxo-acid transaminase [Oryzomicrobium sp.]|uniref:ornithine--oxo-acid transaminase n=1 Tax=Oryzomicrobium sp. TaxID=1911578 RepID=UPI0025D6BA80|nr:ornithine--oxo-acid transaminase [Oryzomicrobium sp.]